MKASKGGNKVKELILQEGIPTTLKKMDSYSEPVIYMLGDKLIGGFLRTHKKKGVRENLNSPGAVYKELCMSDLQIQIEDHHEENVYGWVAHLSLLALEGEIRKSKS